MVKAPEILGAIVNRNGSNEYDGIGQILLHLNVLNSLHTSYNASMYLCVERRLHIWTNELRPQV